MIEAALECLLFVAGEPVSLADLARAVCSDELTVEAALRSLQISMVERGSGLQVVRIAGGWQLATRTEHADVVGKLLARGVNKLSRAALETLAIVAYRQPITGPEIEAVRGVSSDGVLQTLMDRRLITESGRKASVGRPMLYRTTTDFLHYFGISDLSQLPVMDLDASPLQRTQVAESSVVSSEQHTPDDGNNGESTLVAAIGKDDTLEPQVTVESRFDAICELS
jgi:segregation and condensation protein B